MDSAVDVIINESSVGKDEKSRQDLVSLIEGSFPEAEISFAGGGQDIADLARQAVERGSRIVIAGGGDGTISAVASALAGTQAALGVLPLGTLNHFAKDLGIALDIGDAVKELAAGEKKRIDVGEVNGRVFINNSGLGLYPAIVTLREARRARGEAKWTAAALAFLKSLARYRLLSIKAVVNGRELFRETPIIFVGNNRYEMKGLNMGSRPRLDAGELSLYIPRAKTRLGLFGFTLRALAGFEVRELDVFLAEKFLIETKRRRLRVSLDGEISVLDTPLYYLVRPAALQVIVPARGK